MAGRRAGTRVCVCARRVCAVLRQTGRLAFLAFSLPGPSPGPSLLSSACDLSPGNSQHGGHTRTSAFPESWWKRSRALVQHSELILEAHGSRVTCWPMISHHGIRLGSLLRTEFLMVGGGDCQCPSPSGVYYPTAVPGPLLVLVTSQATALWPACSRKEWMWLVLWSGCLCLLRIYILKS